MHMNNWDKRFLGLAHHISMWSKDTSTQCGAVLVRPNKSIASMGFNGFPQGVHDNPETLANRADKLKRIIHAEMNALLFLTEPAFSLTMYVWPMLPCHRCAVHIIQSGIMRVVSRKGDIARWEESTDLSKALFKEAGVDAEEIEDESVIIGDGGSGGTAGILWGTTGSRQGRPDYDL
jgi:dCMP deaminase